MASEAEQIEAILQRRTFEWAKSQLASEALIEDLDYDDFITVSPDEVVAHALSHGFYGNTVWEPGDPPATRNNRFVIEPSAGAWEVYFIERGDRDDERRFATREEAVRDVVTRLLESAWIALNHRYWHKHHPELPRLPAFGVPWPAAPRA